LLELSTSPTDIYTLSLHDALPIFTKILRLGILAHIGEGQYGDRLDARRSRPSEYTFTEIAGGQAEHDQQCNENSAPRQMRPISPDRKSTRLNSSHGSISYAVFCLK